MKLLLNDKEIAHFLLSLIDFYTPLSDLKYNTDWEFVIRKYIVIEKNKSKYSLDKMRKKFKDKIHSHVKRDANDYLDRVKQELENRRNSTFEKIHKNIDFFIKQFGLENILEEYKKSEKRNFVKSVGLKIDPTASMMRRKEFTDHSMDCLIRNTVGNEGLLVNKIDKNYPFWFIDSGFTNFLEPAKTYHRLVRSHLHYGKYFEAPVDRMGQFKSFPAKWRPDGEFIYIIEPGPFAAQIFHCDLKTWKYDVEKELRQYTDKKIKFREKAPKNERTNLYEELCNEDYYCIISINSNAATESIWAGVPAITLDRHVTNPVTVNKLSDINDLYRGNLANWLAFLSYNQFTKEELLDGTAYKIVTEYHV